MTHSRRSAIEPRGDGALWVPALAFLGCLYLLTLPMTWRLTDQAEMLLSARRLVEHGTLTLADDGARPVPEAPWAPRRAGEPVRSRLHPGTPILLAPLLILDKALGLEDRDNLGTLVHLQGFVFTVSALALAGSTLAHIGVSPGSTALSLLLVGTSSPVWQMARNGGAEAVLALALVVYVNAGARARHARMPWKRIAPRLLVLVLMPWVHPTGAVLAAALALVALWPGATPPRVAASLMSAAAFGGLSFALVWNLGFHGDLVAGGYTLVGGERFFGATHPRIGLTRLAADLCLLAPLPLALLMLPGRGPRGPFLAELREPAVLVGALLALFASYYQQETARRFSAVLPALTLPVALAAQRLQWRFPLQHMAAGAGIVVGSAWFVREAGHYYLGSDGLFYPSVVWVKLAIDRGPSATWIVPVASLLFGLAVAWQRTSRTLAGSVGHTS